MVKILCISFIGLFNLLVKTKIWIQIIWNVDLFKYLIFWNILITTYSLQFECLLLNSTSKVTWIYERKHHLLTTCCIVNYDWYGV